MGKYLSYLNTLNESTLTAEEMAKQIGDGIKEVFPKSYVVSRVESHLGTAIHVSFALGDKGEWENNIIQNDPVRTIMMIGFDQINKDGTMQDKVTVDSSTNGITVKPTDQYLARGRVKFPIRKKTDTPEKIVKYVIDYFSKLKQAIKDNLDKMMDDDAKLAKTKV